MLMATFTETSEIEVMTCLVGGWRRNWRCTHTTGSCVDSTDAVENGGGRGSRQLPCLAAACILWHC